MSLYVFLCQGVEGQSFRKAELELALLDSFNSLLSSQRSRPREDNMTDGSSNEIVPHMAHISELFSLIPLWLPYEQKYEDHCLLFHCVVKLLSNLSLS